MGEILIKKVYKLIDGELFEKIPGIEPLDSVCIDIKNQANPVYTFAYRLLKDVNGKMDIRKSEIKSINEEVIKYESEPDNTLLAQLAYKGSPNKKCGDKLYSTLEKYLVEAGL